MKITKREALPKTPRIMRVAAYVRVSTGSEDMLHSLSAQVSYYNEYIQKRLEWEFAGIYADEALTGTKENRPEFQRLLADCRAGKIDMVVTKSVTRFARNTVTTLAVVRELRRLGINVYFENQNIDSMSGNGEFMLSLIASHAQEESRNTSESIKWRIRKSFMKGTPFTARVMGYRKCGDIMVVQPDEAEIVKQIFEDYLGGMGAQSIARKLYHASIPSSSLGVKWWPTTVFHILRNEVYTGVLLLQKTFVADHISKRKVMNNGELPMYRMENAHEAIIDKATFDAVQDELKHRAKPMPKRETNKHLFSSLIRCGICGKPYTRRRSNIGKRCETTAWICHGYATWGKSYCPSQQVPERILTLKTQEVLGIPSFDETALRSKITKILVPAHNLLRFVFKDDSTVDVEWKRLKRRSWEKGETLHVQE